MNEELDPTLANAAAEAAEDSPDTGELLHHIPFIFRDGLDMPISELEVFITMPSGRVCTAFTPDSGAVTVEVPPGSTGQARIEVTDHKGQRQHVCSVDLQGCQGAAAVMVRSPKVKVDVPLRPLQQASSPATAKTPAPAPAPSPTPSAPPARKHELGKTEPARVNPYEPWWQQAVHTAWGWLGNKGVELPEHRPPTQKTALVLRTRSNAGQPVSVVVGPECPNPQRLRLGRNGVYREAILLAAKRLGLAPQAICALIDCEAAKLPEKIALTDAKGQPIKDKKGKPAFRTIRELWNPNSGNAQSGAAGLTQFLASTWLDHVLRPGYYIHEQCVANGWVKKAQIKKGLTRWAFALADGKTTTTPYSHRSDATVQKCLAMRMDPTWSILAAADYGNANLKLLKAKGFKIDTLQDMDKAKLMYLMHHEGEGAGPAFINNTLGQLRGGADGLRKKFEAQLGKDGKTLAGQKIAGMNDDVEAAYRFWFAEFADKKFTAASSTFFCSSPQHARELSDLLVVLGGQEISEP
jgi:hypothetical protein